VEIKAEVNPHTDITLSPKQFPKNLESFPAGSKSNKFFAALSLQLR